MNTLIASRKMYNACLEELIAHYKETGKLIFTQIYGDPKEGI